MRAGRDPDGPGDPPGLDELLQPEDRLPAGNGRGTSTRPAQQSEEVALGRYRAGVGSILDLLAAQTAFANARAQEIRRASRWFLALAQLAHDTGNAPGSRGRRRRKENRHSMKRMAGRIGPPRGLRAPPGPAGKPAGAPLKSPSR